MSKYTGKTFTVERPATEVAEKFSDLTAMREIFDQLPAEEREKVGDITFEKDSISVSTKQLGNVSFQVASLSPEQVTMKAVGLPVPMALNVDMKPLSVDSTDVTCSVDIDIPMMLRPMVAPHMQKAVDMISDVIGKIVG